MRRLASIRRGRSPRLTVLAALASTGNKFKRTVLTGTSDVNGDMVVGILPQRDPPRNERAD